MSDEDFIQALQQSVKQEIVQNYFRERRIIEEEILLVTEAASAYHGGLAYWEKSKSILARALATPRARRRFFDLAGMELPSPASLAQAPPAVGLRPIRGLTRASRYIKLIEGLYASLREQAVDLEEERQRGLSLMEEVNGDIKIFEANFDLLSLSAYLRSLDPVELQRRKILGVNFTAKERALSADALSFKVLDAARMGLAEATPVPAPVSGVMAQAKDLLKQVARQAPEDLAKFL